MAKHILLVEPDTVQSALIAKALSGAGMTIDTAESAQSAITAADSRLPDAVVLELVLPAHNGIEFLHEFRSYPEWSQVPVVLFSSQHADKELLTNLPYVSYLYKPHTTLADLIRYLKDLLT